MNQMNVAMYGQLVRRLDLTSELIITLELLFTVSHVRRLGLLFDTIRGVKLKDQSRQSSSIQT